MALYLVQHGKSLPKEQDPEQALTEDGIADVKRIAAVAKGYGVKPSRILHSGKLRAKQTAKLIAEQLEPSGGVSPRNGLDPNDDVAAVAGYLDPKEDLMVVGHLPFLERLTSLLTSGLPEKLVFKFQNGGIVCLDLDRERHAWYIKWTLMPQIG
ncbi:MAG: phosphohistidine phosphatase SixA [Deltaproteobacteria bacterium]|nr:phosphohistidine phosphatase SixA [Deltaproteobacteria bacterium]